MKTELLLLARLAMLMPWDELQGNVLMCFRSINDVVVTFPVYRFRRSGTIIYDRLEVPLGLNSVDNMAFEHTASLWRCMVCRCFYFQDCQSRTM